MLSCYVIEMMSLNDRFVKNPWDKADINSLFLLQIWLLPYYQFYCCSCWLVILLIYSLTSLVKKHHQTGTPEILLHLKFVADMYNFFCGLWILSTLLAWKNVIGIRDKCIFVQKVFSLKTESLFQMGFRRDETQN